MSLTLPVYSVLQVLFVLVNTIIYQLFFHVFVIHKNTERAEQRPADHVYVVHIGLVFVGVFRVHELGNGEVECFFHLTLLEELVEQLFHPLAEPFRSHYLELVTKSESDAKNKSSIFDRSVRELISKFRFQLCLQREVL